METLINHGAKPPVNTRGFLIGGIVGLLVIAAGIWFVLQTPPMEDQKAAILEGSLLPGTPEFEELTKDIVISPTDQTIVSPNAFGSISMYIVGRVRNKGTHVMNGLEVNVSVVDRFNTVIREKRVLVVPAQRPSIGPGEVIPITLTIDGFRREDDRANIRWRVTAIRTEKPD
jgi:hypothetical protein